MDDAWIDFYAGLNPAHISGTKDPMVTLDYYDLKQLKAAYDAGREAARQAFCSIGEQGPQEDKA